MKINEKGKEEMEALVNPYFEKGKRLMSRKNLGWDQFARLLYLDQANSFWCARYDQPFEKIYGKEPPYEKLTDRSEIALNEISMVDFFLNWLRSYVLKSEEYETNAFIHLMTLEALLVEARKNEDIVTYSRLGESLLSSLWSRLGDSKGSLGEEWPKIQETLSYLSTTLGAYKNLRDGFLIPDPQNAFQEADEAGEGYEALKQKRQNAKDPAEIEETMESEDLAQREFEALKDQAERLDREAEEKMELLERTFKSLTNYILFLRGSRVIIDAVGTRFNSTGEAWVMKADRLEDLEKRTREIINAIEIFTTRIIDDRRQTLEEAQEEKEAFDKMEGGPARIKLLEEMRAPQVSPTITNIWLHYRAGSKLVSSELETKDTKSLLETKAYWRGKAIKLKEALEKDFTGKNDTITRIKHGYLRFIKSRSDFDFINEFCGIKNLEG